MLYFRWYFAVISVSGVFAVTFSVIFAYVADITQEHERSMAYGMVCMNDQKTLWCWISISLYVNASVVALKGFRHVCGESRDKPGDRSVSQPGLWRQSGCGFGFCYRHAGHLLHPGGRARVAPRENETGVLGRSDLMGASGSFRCELILLCVSRSQTVPFVLCNVLRFFAVSEEGGPGLDGSPHLYHSVSVLPAWGWTVFKFLSVSATGPSTQSFTLWIKSVKISTQKAIKLFCLCRSDYGIFPWDCCSVYCCSWAALYCRSGQYVSVRFILMRGIWW